MAGLEGTTGRSILEGEGAEGGGESCRDCPEAGRASELAIPVRRTPARNEYVLEIHLISWCISIGEQGVFWARMENCPYLAQIFVVPREFVPGVRKKSFYYKYLMHCNWPALCTGTAMSRIRPISPSMAQWQRRRRDSDNSSANTQTQNLPAPVSSPREEYRAVPLLLDCALNVQMMSKPAPLGIRASQMDQARFHAAYAQAANCTRSGKLQKIA